MSALYLRDKDEAGGGKEKAQKSSEGQHGLSLAVIVPRGLWQDSELTLMVPSERDSPLAEGSGFNCFSRPMAGEWEWDQDQGMCDKSPHALPGAVISFLLLQLSSQLCDCVDYKLFCRGSRIILSL